MGLLSIKMRVLLVPERLKSMFGTILSARMQAEALYEKV